MEAAVGEVSEAGRERVVRVVVAVDLAASRVLDIVPVGAKEVGEVERGWEIADAAGGLGHRLSGGEVSRRPGSACC